MPNPSMIAMQDEEDGPVYDHPRFSPTHKWEGGGDTLREFYYLAGPMSNLPAFNFPRFHAVSGKLRQQGYNIVSPAQLDSEIERSKAESSPDGSHDAVLYRECLRRDLKLIINPNCVGIICLEDWFKSFGARAVEVYNARWLGLPIYLYGENNDDMVLTEFDPLATLKFFNRDWIES